MSFESSIKADGTAASVTLTEDASHRYRIDSIWFSHEQAATKNATLGFGATPTTVARMFSVSANRTTSLDFPGGIFTNLNEQVVLASETGTNMAVGLSYQKVL